MRKKIFDFKREFDTNCKKHFHELKIDFHGSQLDKNSPAVYRA